jgi:hypothetical protein
VPKKAAQTSRNESADAESGESVVLPAFELLSESFHSVAAFLIGRVRSKQWTEVAAGVLLIQAILRKWEELTSFGVPPGPEQSKVALQRGATALYSLYKEVFSAQEAARLANAAYYKASEAHRGRQPKRRYVAAAALEAKQRNPKLTRLELARMFCPCNKQRHGRQCAERVRRDILRLKALIRSIEDLAKSLRQIPA